MILRDWRFWVAMVLIGFWIWRVIVDRIEIGLGLFATSLVLPIAAFLILSAVTRTRRGASLGGPLDGRAGRRR